MIITFNSLLTYFLLINLVYADGSICLDILQNQWSPIYDVAAILTSIQVIAIYLIFWGCLKKIQFVASWPPLKISFSFLGYIKVSVEGRLPHSRLGYTKASVRAFCGVLTNCPPLKLKSPPIAIKPNPFLSTLFDSTKFHLSLRQLSWALFSIQC